MYTHKYINLFIIYVYKQTIGWIIFVSARACEVAIVIGFAESFS